MKKQRPDIIEMLEGEQKYHIEQLRRVNLALAALRGETAIGTRTEVKKSAKRIQWTEEVMKILDEDDTGLNLEQIRNKLAEKGIAEALEEKYKATIYSTLSRGLKKEQLEKAGYGLYRKKMIPKFMRTQRPTEEGTEPIEKG